MAELSPQQWLEAEDLFSRALELPIEERAVFLQRECPKEELRREVASLLLHAASEPLPAAATILAAAAAMGRDVNPDERLLGMRLGPYRVESIAGYGGMGAVYRASRVDHEFVQDVAIKLVRVAAESPGAQQRFRQERQILARLSHPNIARLLDGGSTPEGVPYLVMEFIQGEPITTWCEQRALNVEERLRIFMPVCGGVESANAERIIHRDLKPANILVTRDGVPKLLDFGIAKMLDAEDREPMLTATPFIAMTPDYASPEQVRGEPVTAATDVYSLGLILYEILTGEKAQRFPEHTPDTIARVVCFGEPTPPALLKSHLSGDLDNIIRKAIRKEPERRYQTAADLCADITRYIHGRPVTARPDTFGYRAGKFARRNRNALRAGAVSALTVGGAVALAYWIGRPPAAPRVAQVELLTQTGHVEVGSHVVTDGSKLYFGERAGGRWTLAQVPVTGGTPARIPVPLFNPSILDISPDRSQLLVAAGRVAADNESVWTIALQGNSPPHHVIDLQLDEAAWSRDGHRIFFVRGSAIFSVNTDGTEQKKISDVPGTPIAVRESPLPDRDVLRFSLSQRNHPLSRIWEVGVNGIGLHALPRHENDGQNWPERDYAGDWSATGGYYFFRSQRAEVTNFWALREARSLFSFSSPRPVQIYSNPAKIFWAAPSLDGKRIFFVAGRERRDLVRFDPTLNKFLPFLPGVAGRSVSFSHDDNQVAYTTIPLDTLWVSRTDGSGRIQLTPPEMRTQLPRWSPDGKSIAFEGALPGTANSIYVVSPGGGIPEEIGKAPESGPSWSPDGRKLLMFCGVPDGSSRDAGLYILDWKTRNSERVPGSETFLYGAWSPNPRYIAASGADAKIHLFDFRTQSWTLLAEGAALGYSFWSHDGKYVYYQDVLGGEDQPIFRVRIQDRKTERLMSAKELPQADVTGYSLSGLAPDDAPIANVIRSNSDLYALDLELP